MSHDIFKNAIEIDAYADLPQGSREQAELCAELAIAVRQYRKTNHLSQSDFAAIAGIKQSQVSNIENCDSNLTFETASAILAKIGKRLSVVECATTEVSALEHKPINNERHFLSDRPTFPDFLSNKTPQQKLHLSGGIS